MTPPPTLGAGAPPPEGTQSIPFRVQTYIASTGEYPVPDGGPAGFTLAMLHSVLGQSGQVPFNAVPADGRLLTADQTHAALYSIVLNQYGGEPPAFALPDLRGRAVIGSNPGIADPADTVPMLWIMATQSVPGLGQGAMLSAGIVMPFPGTAAPFGWVVCDGSCFTQAQYPELFALFGNAFGWLTTTEVALPRLTDTVVIGAGAPYVPGGSATRVGTTIGGPPLQGLCLNYLICWNGLWPYAAPNTGIPFQQGFIGQMVAYAGSTAPTGWLICDGSLIPIESYEELFVMIGNSFGGDGETNFALPDLRGKMIVGPTG